MDLGIAKPHKTFTKEQEESDLSALKVPWRCKGAVLHNVVLAMTLAPCFHTSLRLKKRCELALTGFLCLDLFKILADDLCSGMQLPRGSCYMAPQTVQNLQSAALGVITICVSKDRSFNPWTYGFGRTTELSIEQTFGMLRVQSRNAQLSTRAFLQADARLAMKNSKVLNREKVRATPNEEPLTDTECLAL